MRLKQSCAVQYKDMIKSKYNIINLRTFVNSDHTREDLINKVFSGFSSPQNLEVEYFLKNNSVDFSKRGNSITYLVISKETSDVLGFYSITVRPLLINPKLLSKNYEHKLKQHSLFDFDRGAYSTAAFLIAQLGKNYAISKQNQIDGQDLLQLASETIRLIQDRVGGFMTFLEYREDNKFLKHFYEAHGYREFDSREESSGKQRLAMALKFL